MSLAQEGYNAGFSLGGTALALMDEVTYKHTVETIEWANMGTAKTSDVLFGVEKYGCTAKHGYIDNTFQNVLTNRAVLTGSIFPRGGTTPVLVGSCVVTSANITGMKREAAAAVMEDITFIMYNVTQT